MLVYAIEWQRITGEPYIEMRFERKIELFTDEIEFSKRKRELEKETDYYWYYDRKPMRCYQGELNEITF